MSYSKPRFPFFVLVCTILMCFPLASLLAVRTICYFSYERNIEGYLKRAADANTVEIAKTQLEKAIHEIESRKWTEGSTHIFWTNPSTDVGFWYQNLTASVKELDKVTDETPPMERTNLLMKLRETLVDHNKEGVKITAPDGISMHPNNKTYFWTLCGVVPLALLGVVWLCAACAKL